MEKIYKDGEVLEAVDLNASFAELEAKINNLLTPEWKPINLTPTWVSIEGFPAEYCKLGNLVVLRGIIRHQTGSRQESLFVLPEEARPKVPIMLPSNTTSDGKIASIRINPDGNADILSHYNLNTGFYNIPITGSFYTN
ncbi:MAG: hypothetical protein E6180_01690 [Varibaculum cambriense]|nr:hypothetical protein [Varibaculum cambriense]